MVLDQNFISAMFLYEMVYLTVHFECLTKIVMLEKKSSYKQDIEVRF